MMPGHDIRYKERQRPCCDRPEHYDRIAVCSCGWESRPNSDVGYAVMGHRLDCIEKALGVASDERS